MKDFLLTLKFLLKQNLSLKHIISNLKNDKRQRNMFIVVAIVLALSTPSLGGFIYLYTKMYDILASMGNGQESFFIVMGIIFSTMMIILIGMYQITSYFYMSNDVKILTPLPIKTKHILLSKFTVIYLWELIISVFTVLPFFMIYAIKSGIDVLAWINMILSFILLPIIPLVIIGIIVVFIMKFTNFFKNRDAFRMIGMLVFIIAIVGFQLYMQRLAISAPKGQEAEYFQNLFTNNQFLLERVSQYYPIITLVNNSIIGSVSARLISILLYSVISIGSVYIFGFILESVYLKTYLNEQEQLNKNRKVRHESNKTASVIYSIMSVDMKTLLRVPMFALNCLSTVVLIPAILLITIMGTGEIGEMLNFYEPNKYIFWFICAIGLVMMGSINMITSTSFSREGKTNWIMRTLPISPSDQIKARTLTAVLVHILFSIVSIGILLYLLKTDYIYGILTLIMIIIASLPIHLAGLYVDLKRPVLKWDNPQVAVKQNMNVLISMAITMIFGTILVLIYVLYTKVVEMNSFNTFIVLYTIFLLLNILIASFIYRVLEKQFEESLKLME